MNKLSIFGIIKWSVLLLLLPVVLLMFLVLTGMARAGMMTGFYWILCALVAFLPTRERIEWILEGKFPRWLVFVSVLYLFVMGSIGLLAPWG